MMVVRVGLGVRVGKSLGAVCLANGMSGAVGFGLIAMVPWFLVFYVLSLLMPFV